MPKPDFTEVFPVGARVRCESEMWEGRPTEYGTVESHRENQWGEPQWLTVHIDDDGYGDQHVEYDYRYLDTDMKRSMVKVVK